MRLTLEKQGAGRSGLQTVPCEGVRELSLVATVAGASRAAGLGGHGEGRDSSFSPGPMGFRSDMMGRDVLQL